MWRAEKAGWIGVIALTLTLAACGSKGAEQPADPTPADPAADPAVAPAGGEGDKHTEPAAKPDEPAKPDGPTAKLDEPAKPDEPAAKAEVDAGPTEAAADAGPTEAEGDAGAAANAEPDTLSKHGFNYPGKNTVVRECDPESPEGVIQRAILAAMNPDEEKGWQQFESLLHSSQLIPNALTSRRQLNFPAMRRKVSLFLVEEGKPYYKWAYAEEPDEGVIKVFVHNPKSMPTPCYLAMDPEADNKWRIKSCSL